MTQTDRNQLYTRFSVLLVAGFSLFRMAVMGQTGLGDSESYYWAWSQHLALSYFDHPPMVAWLIRLFTDIGGDNPFMVRLPSVLLFILMGYLFHRISMEMFDDARVAFYSILTFNLVPVFGIGAMQMVPDIPSAVCYLAYTLVLHKLLVSGGPGRQWYLLGAIMGVGLLGKYFAILLAPSVIILVASVPEYRRWFARPQPYIMALIALALFSPVLIWNFSHDWPSFRFHLVDRHGSAGFSMKNLEHLVGGQLLYITPLYLFGFLWAAWSAIKRALKGDRRYATLAAFCAPTIIFFYVVCAWTNDSEPHWPAFGYLTAIIAMSALGLEKWDNATRKTARRVKGYFVTATGMAALGFIVFYIHVFHPILPIKPKYDIVNELYGWDKVGAVVDDVYRKQARKHDGAVFALARHWVLCSQAMFSTRGEIPVACVNKSNDQFDFWDDPPKLYGKTAVVITDLRFPEPPDTVYRFSKVERVAEIPIYRGGVMTRKFTIWVGDNFQGLASSSSP